MKKLVVVAASALVSLALLAPTAAAHPQTALDTDDSPGPLDTVAARVSDKQSDETGRRYFELRLVTYEEWSDATVGGGKNFIAFEFQTDKDELIDRCLVITQREVEPDVFALEANVYRECNYFNSDRVSGTQLITRPDQHSVDISIGRRALLGRGVRAYRWRSVTSFEEQQQSSECAAPEPHGDGGYGACADFTRWIRHRL